MFTPLFYVRHHTELKAIAKESGQSYEDVCSFAGALLKTFPKHKEVLQRTRAAALIMKAFNIEWELALRVASTTVFMQENRPQSYE